MIYGYKKEVSLAFDEALEKIKANLAEEGFGLLFETDVKDTFKKKLNISHVNYFILGVCNPAFAHETLMIDKEVGLLLPCNVIVFEENGKVYIASILPSVVMRNIENDELTMIAEKVELKLKKVIDKTI